MTLFAVVDVARHSDLHRLVHQTREHVNLYEGAVAEEIDQVSPYLVAIDEHSPLSAEWNARGWGQSWGLMLESARTLAEVRHHFRHYLQAMLPDGNVVQFRFYDPRVWRVYLPTCTADELAGWFSGVAEYRCENEDGTAVHRYRFDGSNLLVA